MPLKVTAPIIVPSLRKLFNKSLRLGSVPEEWKPANVVPVHKKGNKGQTENYRPISLLSNRFESPGTYSAGEHQISTNPNYKQLQARLSSW